MTDEAQAVAALAGFGGKVVDAVAGVGRYAAEVFGTVPHDLVGLAGGDRLRQRRTRNALRYQAETIKLLEHVDPDRISEPSASVLIPWMQGAADEEREELRRLWAALLANAAVDGGRKVRREFFETLRQMEPLDARVLISLENKQGGGAVMPSVELIRRLTTNPAYPATRSDVVLSLNALDRLRCANPPHPSIAHSANSAAWSVTDYGAGLLSALEVR